MKKYSLLFVIFTISSLSAGEPPSCENLLQQAGYTKQQQKDLQQLFNQLNQQTPYEAENANSRISILTGKIFLQNSKRYTHPAILGEKVSWDEENIPKSKQTRSVKRNLTQNFMNLEVKAYLDYEYLQERPYSSNATQPSKEAILNYLYSKNND